MALSDGFEQLASVAPAGGGRLAKADPRHAIPCTGVACALYAAEPGTLLHQIVHNIALKSHAILGAVSGGRATLSTLNDSRGSSSGTTNEAGLGRLPVAKAALRGSGQRSGHDGYPGVLSAILGHLLRAAVGCRRPEPADRCMAAPPPRCRASKSCWRTTPPAA